MPFPPPKPAVSLRAALTLARLVVRGLARMAVRALSRRSRHSPTIPMSPTPARRGHEEGEIVFVTETDDLRHVTSGVMPN